MRVAKTQLRLAASDSLPIERCQVLNILLSVFFLELYERCNNLSFGD